jgi:peptidoglycan hydrolase CwlO-like protein
LSGYYSSYITKAAQIILKEAENYTYQRLLVAEENFKKDIQEFSKKINQISLEVKSTYIKVDEHERKIKVLSRELLDWESTEEKKISIKEK